MWLRTVNHYDSKYRLIQSVASHQKGIVRISSILDFVGRVLNTKRTYIVNGASLPITERFSYDHMGRVQTVKHSVNGATEVTVVKNEYNALGQLADKKLHNTDQTNFKQSVDYRFNIRDGSLISTMQMLEWSLQEMSPTISLEWN
jgi:hypothetical protein